MLFAACAPVDAFFAASFEAPVPVDDFFAVPFEATVPVDDFLALSFEALLPDVAFFCVPEDSEDFSGIFIAASAMRAAWAALLTFLLCAASRFIFSR